MNTDHEFQRIRLHAAFAFTVVRSEERSQILPRNDTVQSFKELVLLAPTSYGEFSANKSANEGVLIFIITLFCSVLIILHYPPFAQRFLDNLCKPAFPLLENKYRSGNFYTQSLHKQAFLFGDLLPIEFGLFVRLMPIQDEAVEPLQDSRCV